MMNKASRIEKTIEDSLRAIANGQESLDSILEKYPKDTGEIRPRLEAALWLENASNSLSPRPGFVASTRRHLEQRIALSPPRTIWQRLFSPYATIRRFFNLTAVALLVTIFALVVNSVTLAARLSIPGDPLYSTKLAIEGLQLAYTLDPVAKTGLYIQFSRERTAEFVDLVLEGNYELLPVAADRMETDIIAALRSLDNASLHNQTIEILMAASLRGALSSEIVMLNVLRGTSPTSAHPGIDLALNVAQSGMMALR